LFRENAVNKPWGYEYLAYESEDVALWVLHLNKGFSTSMHAHPQKTTGLVILSGSIELGFIADSKVITAPDKQMIRRGLFHQSRAISDNVILLEVETPNDKGDLVRLFDDHGREALGYESQKNYFARDSSHLWIDSNAGSPPLDIHGFSSPIRIQKIKNLSDFNGFDNESIIMFLSGGVGKVVGGRAHLATVPGDIAKYEILKVVIDSMEFAQDDTLILKVN